VDAIILDGAVVVQMLQPKAVSTFEEYFDSVVAPYILRQLEDVKRLDIVWDVFKDDSLKKVTREKRGSGQWRKVLFKWGWQPESNHWVPHWTTLSQARTPAMSSFDVTVNLVVEDAANARKPI